ncbi:hypothetical protein IMCC3317_09380 [Kordia antarctica]|uniref:Secretion system C-terminal sorting domain-containing protein n=1 Tax=Kordia antarctica TaxID=1218801 RepID=A0A7L4ZG00_9FLAO|nr:T9SS type A sorting domain-containing protein [Kordia antarctica]QHI35592.1 hypothetical protein IMCC3317_09380 [Kordia antarctica]
MKKKIFFLSLFLLATLFVTNAQDFDFYQLGNDIDGEAVDDKSGWSIALSADGSTVIIGSIRNDGNGDQSGHVRVYEKIANVWTQIGDDIDGDAASNFLGGAVAISTDGSVIAIGASGNNVIGLNSGQAKIFKNLNGTWSQIGDDIFGEAFGNQFGGAIGLSGDGNIVAIGGSYHDNNGNDSAGHVRVFENLNGTWTQIGNSIEGEDEFDYSGRRLSMSSDGSIVAIGAPFNDGNGRNSGHVRVYENLNGIWTKVGDDIDGSAMDDNSGWSVSLSADGSTLAIGAPFNDGNGDRSGQVRVFRNINGIWTQFGADIYGEVTGDLFGYSTSLNTDGTILAVSGINNDGNGSNSGFVQIYKNENNTWTQIGTNIHGETAGDNSGYSISLSGDAIFVAISALNNDGNGSNSGHVRVYEFKPTLGVEDISLNSDDVVFYPNPSKHSIFFNEEIHLEEVILYSLDGKQLVTQNMQRDAFLDISNLANGTYILKIKTAKGLITKKLIKQ